MSYFLSSAHLCSKYCPFHLSPVFSNTHQVLFNTCKSGCLQQVPGLQEDWTSTSVLWRKDVSINIQQSLLSGAAELLCWNLIPTSFSSSQLLSCLCFLSPSPASLLSSSLFISSFLPSPFFSFWSSVIYIPFVINFSSMVFLLVGTRGGLKEWRVLNLPSRIQSRILGTTLDGSWLTES